MAPKAKSRLVDQPPSASSSEEQQEQVEESQEEEEEQSGEEESGEETEEDEPKTAPPVDKKQVQTPQKPQSSSESGTENGSGSESESEAESGQSQPSPSASDFTVKPSVPAKTAPLKPPAKRPQENQQTQKEKESSRKKKPKIVEEEEKKSAATSRSLWSDEDQVALLKGMVEYKAQKSTEPNADMSAFHEFIKGKLQADVSKSQLSDKLRRLKKKFLTNVKDGEDPVFSKGQDYLVFEYSKKIWGAPVSGKGDGGGTSNGVKENVSNSTNGKAKKNVAVKKSAEPKKSAKGSSFTKTKDDEKHKEEEKEKQVAVKEVVKEDIVKGGDQQDFKSRYPRLAASFENMGGMCTMYPDATNYLKENTSLIASDKAKVLEEKWKKLQDDEAVLMSKRLDLIAEHYRLVVDAMKGN